MIIDAGSILDLSWLGDYPIDGALFVWQGGMESGNAVADLLTGKVTPCGKLSDTVALRYEDYPSQNFLGQEYNQYTEDIYVGYRYFETFAKDAVQFPFGFGLSYTTFALENVQVKTLGDTVRVKGVGEEHRLLPRQRGGARSTPLLLKASWARPAECCAPSRRPSCSSLASPRP